MDVFKIFGLGLFVDIVACEVIVKRVVVINNFMRLHEVFPWTLVYRLRDKKANYRILCRTSSN